MSVAAVRVIAAVRLAVLAVLIVSLAGALLRAVVGMVRPAVRGVLAVARVRAVNVRATAIRATNVRVRVGATRAAATHIRAAGATRGGHAAAPARADARPDSPPPRRTPPPPRRAISSSAWARRSDPVGAASCVTEISPFNSSADACEIPNPDIKQTDNTVAIKVRFMARFPLCRLDLSLLVVIGRGRGSNPIPAGKRRVTAGGKIFENCA